MSHTLCPFNLKADIPLSTRAYNVALSIAFPVGCGIMNGVAAKVVFYNPAMPKLVSLAILLGLQAGLTWEIIDVLMHKKLKENNQTTFHTALKLVMNIALTYLMTTRACASANWNLPLSFSMKVCFVLCPNALAMLAESLYFHREKKN